MTTAQMSAKTHSPAIFLSKAKLENLVDTFQKIWSSFHHTGRLTRVKMEARYKIQQAVGGMSALWSIMQIAETRRFKKPGDATSLLTEMLSNSGARYSFGRDFCVLISHLANRRNAILELKDATATRCIDSALWSLMRTGALTGLSNTFRNPALPETALERFATELRSMWDDIENLLLDQKVREHAGAFLGRVTGFSLFEGVREQKQDAIEDSVEGLKEWYLKANSRRQRAFFSTVGQGLHDLAMLTQELEVALKSAKAKDHHRKVEALQNSLEVIKIGTISIIMTGVLNLMSV